MLRDRVVDQVRQLLTEPDDVLPGCAEALGGNGFLGAIVTMGNRIAASNHCSGRPLPPDFVDSVTH